MLSISWWFNCGAPVVTCVPHLVWINNGQLERITQLTRKGRKCGDMGQTFCFLGRPACGKQKTPETLLLSFRDNNNTSEPSTKAHDFSSNTVWGQ